ETDPRLAVLMLSELSREVRRSIGQLAVRCGMSTRERVAGHLLSMQQRCPDPGNGRVEITQGALADWVGATRESTARALGELRAEGAISTGRGWVRVLDRRALARSMR
ncbi:MAG: Crp/Fnr family transcriptional regulator, partial [Actinomycetota bacterium]